MGECVLGRDIGTMGLLILALTVYCTNTLVHGQDFTDQVLGEERTFAIQNVSLVITYTTMAVAVVMMASFLWIALSFGGSRSGYGYSGYSSDDYYSRRKRSSRQFDGPDVLTNLLGSWYRYDTEEEDDLVQIGDSETKAKSSMFGVECAYQDACAAGVAKNRENLRTLSLVLSLLQRAPDYLVSLPRLATIMEAFRYGQTEGTCEKYKTEISCT